VCIWNQGGGGPKKFGNRWSKLTVAVFLNSFYRQAQFVDNSKGCIETVLYKQISFRAVFRGVLERHVARMVDRRGAYKVLVGRSDGKRPRGRPRCRWKDNMKMYVK
jgi:hypothetical protein